MEYSLPSGNGTAEAIGQGQFCWETGAPDDQWLLAAHGTPPSVAAQNRLEARLWCVPRYSLSIPITAVPVAIAVVLEILIIVFCICKPHRARRANRYLQV